MRSTVEHAPDAGRVPGPLRAAVVLILVESAALVGAAGFLVVATIVGRPNEVARALIGAAIALLGAAVLAAGRPRAVASAARRPLADRGAPAAGAAGVLQPRLPGRPDRLRRADHG